MKKILIAVDAADPAATQAALAEAVRIYAQGPVAVHLLSVQPPVSGHAAMFFGHRELHELQLSAGADDLAGAEAQLRARNVPYTSCVRIGRSAETIVRTARELGCDRIVLGRAGSAAGLASKVFGSVAQQVRQMLGAGDCQVIGA